MSNSPLRYLVWQWTQAVLLAANMTWTTLCLGGYLARTMVVTNSLTAALLLVHAVGLLVARRPAERTSAGSPNAEWTPHPAGWCFLPFLAYAAANVAWVTPVPWLGWFDWFEWAQLIATFWVVLNGIRLRAAQRAVVGVLLAIGVVGVLMACYQRFVRPEWLMLHRIQVPQYEGRAGGPFGSPNSFAALLLLLIPVSATLTIRRTAAATARVFFGWLTLVLLLGLGLTISRGAWLGLAVSLVVWPMLVMRVAWWRRLTLAAAVAVAVVAVVAGACAVSPTIQGRFAALKRDAGERSRPVLWTAAWKIFRAQPVTGSGGGSFDIRFEQYRPDGFLTQPEWAHNDYVNTLSDYGAAGFVLFFGAAGLVVTVIAARTRRATGPDSRRPGSRRADGFDDPRVRHGMGIGLLAFALQLFVDFHLKVPALAMALATLAGVAVQRVWRVGNVPEERMKFRRTLFLVACVLPTTYAFTIPFWSLPRYRGEACRQHGRGIIDGLANAAVPPPEFRAKVAAARADLDQSVAVFPDNANAWADRAYAAAQWSLVEPAETVALGRQAETDASRAIAVTPEIAEFWIRRGVARDMQGRWIEAGDDFAHAIKLDPRMPLPWFHCAYHLALHPAEHDLASAMVETCLRLDPQNSEGLRLRQRLASNEPRP